jgi:hypothetical protein
MSHVVAAIHSRRAYRWETSNTLTSIGAGTLGREDQNKSPSRVSTAGCQPPRNIPKRGDRMGTSSVRMFQLLVPARRYRSVAPVHHGGHADFSGYIQNVHSHSGDKISGHFCGESVARDPNGWQRIAARSRILAPVPRELHIAEQPVMSTYSDHQLCATSRSPHPTFIPAGRGICDRRSV